MKLPKKQALEQIAAVISSVESNLTEPLRRIRDVLVQAGFATPPSLPRGPTWISTSGRARLTAQFDRLNNLIAEHPAIGLLVALKGKVVGAAVGP